MLQLNKYKKGRLYQYSIIKIVFIITLSFGLYLAQAQENSNKNNDTINLGNWSKQKILNIKVGNVLVYNGSVHPSTGLTMGRKIQNVKIIKLLKEDGRYINPAQEYNPVPGGDERGLDFYFKAIARGKTKIIIERKIHGKILQTEVFNINVK